MSPVYHIDLHPDIEAEYNEDYHWYELQQLGLGERFLSAVHKKIVHISQNPEIYDFKSEKNFREAMVDGFPYLVVSKVYKKKKIVFIDAIHHTSRNPNKKYRK